MNTVLRALIAGWGQASSLVRECRHCGTTVTNENEACPACDRTEVVVYETS